MVVQPFLISLCHSQRCCDATPTDIRISVVTAARWSRCKYPLRKLSAGLSVSALRGSNLAPTEIGRAARCKTELSCTRRVDQSAARNACCCACAWPLCATVASRLHARGRLPIRERAARSLQCAAVQPSSTTATTSQFTALCTAQLPPAAPTTVRSRTLRAVQLRVKPAILSHCSLSESSDLGSSCSFSLLSLCPLREVCAASESAQPLR